MNRVAVVLIATIGGLALLLTFKTSPNGVKRVTVGAIANHPPAGGSGPTTTTIAPANPGSTSRPGSTSPPTTHGPTGAAKTYDGQVADNQYGPVQVRVVIQNGQITDIQALQMPVDRQRSAEISQYAEPQLRSEALQAQSAQIDIVSGATFTSESYAQSLQSALDQAHA